MCRYAETLSSASLSRHKEIQRPSFRKNHVRNILFCKDFCKGALGHHFAESHGGVVA